MRESDIMYFSELETKYIKLDKPIPTGLGQEINYALLERYADKHRFSKNIVSKNTRLSDPLNQVCPDLGYTPYEQAMYNLCNTFNIDVTYTVKTKEQFKEKCVLNLTFDIQQKNLSCKLLSALSIVQKVQKICKYDISTLITEQKCKEYYNELIQQKSCKYSYNQYKNLLSLGFIPQVIEIALSNNVYISPDGKYLTTKTTEYNLANELCFNNVSLEGIGNRTEFLTNIITDLPDDLKQEILNSF